MKTFEEKVKNTILVNGMICPGDRVLAAVSGGQDSVCLLHLLNRLQSELRFELCVAHVNHLARGEESDADADFVAGLGNQLGLQTRIGAIDVKKKQGELKSSFQEAARTLRYQFLESAGKELGVSKIAVAHTADDQVETVLMNLIRGSGLKGLCGIPLMRDMIIRPLFECWKSEVDAYLRQNDLPWREDASNSTDDYLRNRVRRTLLPMLEKDFNKNIKSNLWQTANLLREEERFLQNLAQQQFDKCCILPVVGDTVCLRRAALADLPPALLKRVIRLAVLAIKGDLRRICAGHIKDVLHLLQNSAPDKQIHLPGGVVVKEGRESLEFSLQPGIRSNILYCGSPFNGEGMGVNIPGFTEIRDISLKLQCKLVPQTGVEFKKASANQAFLDYDKTGNKIRARFWRPGDRFNPLGMSGSKKLKSFFIDEKVPRDQRKCIPVLITETGDIIWVYGQRISQKYRVRETTRQILVIEGSPLN